MKHLPLVVMPAFVIDPIMAIAVLFAFLAGWAARAAGHIDKGYTFRAVVKEFVISVLSSLGAAILVIGAVKQFELSWHAAAVLAFFLAMGGVKTLQKLSDSFWIGKTKLIEFWFWVDEHRRRDLQYRDGTSLPFSKEIPDPDPELQRLAVKVDQEIQEESGGTEHDTQDRDRD